MFDLMENYSGRRECWYPTTTFLFCYLSQKPGMNQQQHVQKNLIFRLFRCWWAADKVRNDIIYPRLGVIVELVELFRASCGE